MSARSIAEALGKAERDSKGWKCLCPIHDDHNPSLSIRDVGGNVLVHCHRCGSDGQAKLVEELKRRGLWPTAAPKQHRSRRKIVATYDYRDENGVLRFQKVRFEPKNFSQRRPDPDNDGKWIWDLNGVKPLPYRLPELLAASPDATVFIAEGEKDVDALRGIGAVASCNSDGAGRGGKWPIAISRWFAGRDVVIIPDNDDVGREHARDVAAKLKGAAARIRALVLPGNGKDPFDWIAAGGTLDELTHLAEEASGDAATLPGGLEGEVLPPVAEYFIPLGYTRDERFVFLNLARRIVVGLTAGQASSSSQLVALAPLKYWQDRFPAERRPFFDATAAGDALIKACRTVVPFDMAKVRGRGIWIDRGEIVVNLGGPVPDPRYVCFEPLEIVGEPDPEAAQRLLKLLQRFKWRNPGDAILVLGWIAIAPICGVLDWRPHIWIHGPTQTGKTTLVGLLKATTSPLGLSVDGGSTEAGIRQALGPDSLPVIIDEFESDHDVDRLRGVLRLARSASSAEDAVLRGTPEGRALRFCLRTTFAFASINPIGLEPADASRIVMAELTLHDNDSGTAAEITRETLHFEKQAGAWCKLMVERAALIPETVAVIEPLITAGERRHRQNMATLLAGAAVALEGRVPTEDEARTIVAAVAQTVDLHADEVKRDEGRECLDHLYVHPVQTAYGNFPLWHWIGVVVHGSEDADHMIEARKVLQKYDIEVIHGAGPLDPGGIILKNGSAAINRIYESTKWRGGWTTAIKKIVGVTNNGNRAHRFPSGPAKVTLLPLSVAPDKVVTPEDPWTLNNAANDEDEAA